MKKTEHCSHGGFTGYKDYCVCTGCGWIINYDQIELGRNDASLENYISTVLKQAPSRTETISFDIGVTTQGTVNDYSPNRIKFTVKL